ncbi:MAG: hypothetical protein FWG48_04180 [Oscillospiraceae bacterium]|nr:hypothetical protein [Oscillospiraceae bacterium]
MTVNKQSIEFVTDLLVTNVVDALAERTGRTATETLRGFMRTRTYSLLIDAESYLFFESPLYILDMLDAEEHCDWDRWLEV